VQVARAVAEAAFSTGVARNKNITLDEIEQNLTNFLLERRLLGFEKHKG